MQDLDNRMHTLEAEVKRQKSKAATSAAKTAALPPQTAAAANPSADPAA